ncbi:MAG: hypothetical protein NTX12_06180 [Actinobacteria bacterium]|nr:hypothetical protein [Actinomycetota bacterium]
MGFANFPTNGGVYVLECLNTVVAGQTATLCDTANQIWVSNTTGATFKPVGADIVLSVVGAIAGTTCGADKCSIFITRDHEAPTDRSEDQLIAIAFSAGAVTPTKPKDVISATINGKALSTQQPGTLAYRTPVTIIATGTSGGAVTYGSSTPDCTVVAGVITALKGAGQCDITATTPDSLSTQSTTAHYPFYLAPGNQIVTFNKTSLKSGTTLKLPSITNFGEVVTYSTTSKNCSIKGNVLKANKKGACLVSATAAGSGTLWGPTSQKQTIKIS